MIKKLIIALITLLLMNVHTFASDVIGDITVGYIDDDGILGAVWSAPTVGNTPTGYALSYTINDIADSLTTEVQGLTDSSVVLTSIGDWALLSIRSYFEYWSEFQQQDVRVYSIAIVSDTVVFDQAVLIDPPTGIHWE